ncbi:hypothetical protein AV650_14370 [Serratia fonticola]|uniref:hypothetical protein n=1 Tax=Serratia fonticola TaxID=47917 RepID=UPI000742F70F|nr:hypothetical protein [Serratia fonticola]ALX94665.1 hypothetical protein AV650_14370 [Serratia fonticola]CAI2121763.1 Uncharacterised protein [Serratia fonticola]
MTVKSIKLDNQISDPELYQHFYEARLSERLQLLELLETHINNLGLRHPMSEPVKADLKSWISARRNATTPIRAAQ